MANYHLAILKQPYLEAILDGRKSVESRFTRTRRGPFKQVQVGDRIFLKLSSGPICAVATAAAVKNFENLTPPKIAQLKQQYNHYVKADNAYWHSKADFRFGCLIWLTDLRPIKPVRINKKDWRGWVVLTERENFGLLKPDAIEFA